MLVERLASVGRSPHDLDGILLTHSHADHYRAIGTLHARFGVPVFVDPSTEKALRRKAERSSWRRVKEWAPLPDRIGDLGIEALDTSHGTPHIDGRTVCFQIHRQNRRVAVVTDLGAFDPWLVERLRGVDALLLEANYEDRVVARKLADRSHAFHWKHLESARGERGHLSNAQCAAFLWEVLAGPWNHVLLGHLSVNHGDPDLDNNDFETAQQTVERFFSQRSCAPPQLHRTWRLGREPSRVSERIALE